MVNNVHLLGRVGGQATIRMTATGKKFASLSVATSEKYKGVESTQWHHVTGWDTTAEIMERANKGDSIFVEGKLEYNQGEKNGTQITYANVVARRVYLYPRATKPQDQASSQGQIDMGQVDFDQEEILF